MSAVTWTTTDSPVGPLLLTSRGAGLAGLYLPGHVRGPEPADGWQHDPGPFGAALEQLAGYFSGELSEFDLPLDPVGSPFQLQVWDALRAIPYGGTLSYAELAARVGRPSAARAVGSANARNPLSIVVPCHRVVGASGALTGYAGGVAAKHQLLEHERGVRAGRTATPVRAAAAG